MVEEKAGRLPNQPLGEWLNSQGRKLLIQPILTQQLGVAQCLAGYIGQMARHRDDR